MATTSRMQIQTPNGHDKRTTAISGRALEAMTAAATVAQTKIVAAAGSTEKVVKAHPLKSVGIALGGGLLLGALVAKALTHTPTLSESVRDGLGLKRRLARMIKGWL